MQLTKRRVPFKKVMMIVLTMIITLFIFAACGGGNSPLVGRWDAIEIDGMEMPEGVGMEIYFSSDGTGIITEDIFGDTYEEHITWSSDDGIVTITDDWGTDSGRYRVNGRRLYLYDDTDSVFMILERQ